eukprot:Awhi_evm1s1743
MVQLLYRAQTPIGTDNTYWHWEALCTVYLSQEPRCKW